MEVVVVEEKARGSAHRTLHQSEVHSPAHTSCLRGGVNVQASRCLQRAWPLHREVGCIIGNIALVPCNFAVPVSTGMIGSRSCWWW